MKLSTSVTMALDLYVYPIPGCGPTIRKCIVWTLSRLRLRWRFPAKTERDNGKLLSEEYGRKNIEVERARKKVRNIDLEKKIDNEQMVERKIEKKK